jgi:hypothetical protein
MISDTRTSDQNLWHLIANALTRKRYRTDMDSLMRLKAFASIKLDGSQLIWNYVPVEEGPMELDGIYTHNGHPIAIKNDDQWRNVQPKFMGMNVLELWDHNQEPLQILVGKLYLKYPNATSIRIFSELMHPSCGQVIKCQKGSVYNDSRPELVGTYQVFQAYVNLPGAEKPLMFRPSSVPEIHDLFESVSTPEILLEGAFGPEFMDRLCDILIARHLQDEGAVLHIVKPDGTEFGWKLRTGVTESGEVHYPFFNGTYREIGYLSPEIQSIIGSLKRMFSTTAPERMMNRAMLSDEKRDAKKNGPGKGKQKSNIDMSLLRTQWNKIFTHRDYKTQYNKVKDQHDEVINIRAQMLEAFRTQVVKDQVKSFLEDDGSLKEIVRKNIEGATRNMPAFMKRR